MKKRWRRRREIEAARALLSDFEPVLACELERRRRREEAARVEFEEFRADWRHLVEGHLWRRYLEAGLAEFPQYFTEGYRIPTDRYASLGGGVNLPSARIAFVRQIMNSRAPCKIAENRIGGAAFLWALEDGCSCELHAPDLQRLSPVDFEALFMESLR